MIKKSRDFRHLIPVVIIFLGITITFFKIGFLDQKEVITATLFIIVTICFFINQTVYIILLFLLLLAGLFNLLQFYYAIRIQTLALPNLGLGITYQVNFLIPLLLYFLFSGKTFVQKFSFLMKKLKDDEKESNQSKIIFFKKKYRNLDKENLRKIVDSENMDYYAKLAANDLLNEKNKNEI